MKTHQNTKNSTNIQSLTRDVSKSATQFVVNIRITGDLLSRSKRRKKTILNLSGGNFLHKAKTLKYCIESKTCVDSTFHITGYITVV